MHCQRSLREARKRVLDAAIRAAQRRASRSCYRVRAAFDRLLIAVRERTSILSPRDVATGRSRRIVHALVALAAHRWNWRMEIDGWCPPDSRSDFLVIASLAEHLFARFPVPRFMTHAWLGPRVDLRTREQEWYLLLGAGVSVRSLGLPVELSRAAAHVFRSAPDDLDVLAAIRWSQVIALGGSEVLARAVARSRLGSETGNDAFWESALAFFVAHPEIDPGVIDAVVDYFRERNNRLDAISIDALFAATPHVRPADLALASLGRLSRERLIHEWRNRPAVSTTVLRGTALSWKPAPIEGLLHFHVDPNDGRLRTWRIAELLNGEELRQEGSAMRHCVASYAGKCAAGGASIWSMVVDIEDVRRRVLTIEVDAKTRFIRQAKGPSNARPHVREMEILRLWAERQGLAIERSLAHVGQVEPP